MGWRQWINYLLQFQSLEAPWIAPTVPSLCASRGSVPADSSSSADIPFLTESCDRRGDSDSADTTLAAGSLQRGHISLCSCTLGANGHVQTQHRELSSCLSDVKEKGVILTAANSLSITWGSFSFLDYPNQLSSKHCKARFCWLKKHYTDF